MAGIGAVSVMRAQPQASVPGNDSPVLEVDLRRFGYEITKFIRPTFLEFTDNDQLMWAWLTVDKAPPEKRKKGTPPEPVPSHLHVLILDANTGRK
jgi:hypothetical protein